MVEQAVGAPIVDRASESDSDSASEDESDIGISSMRSSHWSLIGDMTGYSPLAVLRVQRVCTEQASRCCAKPKGA